MKAIELKELLTLVNEIFPTPAMFAGHNYVYLDKATGRPTIGVWVEGFGSVNNYMLSIDKDDKEIDREMLVDARKSILDLMLDLGGKNAESGN